MSPKQENAEERLSNEYEKAASFVQQQIPFVNPAVIESFDRFGYANFTRLETLLKIALLRISLQEHCHTIVKENKVIKTIIKCEESVDSLIRVLVIFDEYEHSKDKYFNMVDVFKKELDLIPIPENKTAILWTGKQAKQDAMFVDDNFLDLRHKYISLEGTPWGEFLDFFTNRAKLSWLNKSWHWELLFQALASKSKISTKENPVIVFISIPVFGAFARQEIRQYLKSPKEEYIDVYWYGEETCEQEKKDRIDNYCNNFEEKGTAERCIRQVNFIDCRKTCSQYVEKILKKQNSNYRAISDTEFRANRAFITCRNYQDLRRLRP